MKKIFYLAFSLSLAFTAASAQTIKPLPQPKVVTDGAVLTFWENKFDFGTIQEGDVVKHTYKFRNTGNQPLIVSEVRVTCGCTSPEWTQTPVAPGQTGFITVQFNSAGKLGQNHKVVSVLSNSVTGTATIAFTTTVKPREANAEAVK